MNGKIMTALLLIISSCTAAPSADTIEPDVLCDEEADLFNELCSKGDASKAIELAKRGELGIIFLKRGLEKGGRAAALCAWAIAQYPHPSATEALETLLRAGDQVSGYWAAKALGSIGDGDSVAALASLLPDERRAFWELGRGPTGLLTQMNVKGRMQAVPAPDWMPNIRVAYAAVEALGRIGGDEAASALMRAVENDQYLIRYGAARALGEMRYQPAEKILREMSKHDPVLIVRNAAKESLKQLHGEPAASAEPFPPMPPAIAFIKTKNRTESNLGFRDSYFFPKMPWYHWGENLYTLTPPAPDGVVKNLTNLENGAVQGPEVSYDGKKILFAMRRDFKTDGFHIFEINVDGTGLRRLTSGNCNDVDPCYLPDGRIAFCSDRAGYREYYHQERSRVLYVIDADGGNIQQITFNPNQDYEPTVLRDGRILYSSYRFYAQDGSRGPLPNEGGIGRIETVLRTIDPDGSDDRLLYGAMRGGFYSPLRPMADSLQYQGGTWRRNGNHVGVSISQARELPDGRLICVSPAGLTVVDLSLHPLDCETPFYPEIINIAGGEETYIFSHDEINPVGRYTTPYPAGGSWVFVSYAPWYDRRNSAYGVYLFNMVTREMRLVCDDPELSDIDPIPIAPRARERIIPSRLPTSEERWVTGFVFCNSVFNSDLPFDRWAVKYVRVIEAQRLGLSMNANASFRSRVLGTAPVFSDGSFHVEVPADTPFRFQLLDMDGKLLIHETAFNYVRPGERKGCIGCHEPKGFSPRNEPPLAVKHPPFRAVEKPGDLIYMGQTWRPYNMIAR